jgi:hypothetical protein
MQVSRIIRRSISRLRAHAGLDDGGGDSMSEASAANDNTML